MRRLLVGSLTLACVFGVLAAAQERPDEDMYWRIRQEGTRNSHIMRSMHVLTDVYGPRLTGSPNLKAAGEWVLQQAREWGLANGRLEPWDFGHPGWTNERLSAHLVAPVQDALVAEVLAWTPGTNGVARGPAVQITLPQTPTRAELAVHLEGLSASVRGAMVLVGPPTQVPVTFNAAPLRSEDADVLAQMNAPPPQAGRGGGRGGGQPAQPNPNRRLTAREIDEQLNAFLLASGALVRVNDGARGNGQIRAFDNRTFDVAKAPPTVVMRNEDYGRISRLLGGGRAVELEFEIVNRTHPEGRTNYNVIVELPGTDKANEVVMIGAHLDSWHAGTGATDNAVGSATTLEVLRILATIGATPRRTIRLALWSGEEQGLLGSQAYVREHFGTFEAQKPEFAGLAAYLNIDTGTGRARGLTVFGPPEAGTILREAAAPLADLGLLGATTTRSRQPSSTDSFSFNAAGLPGINTLQDPIEYRTHTWHTNLDTYERIVEDDAKKSAIVLAAVAYHLAMRDEVLPRFAAGDMPAPPPPPRTQETTTATD